MTTQTEALKLALEALKHFYSYGFDRVMCEKAIISIKETSEQFLKEPVAFMHTKLDGVVVPHRPADLDRYPERWIALYKETKPCQTCEALARTVMLDQTYYENQTRGDDE